MARSALARRPAAARPTPRPWTAEEDARLREMLSVGLSNEFWTAQLPGRTFGEITERIYVLQPARNVLDVGRRITAPELVALLRRTRLPSSREDKLQLAIEEAFKTAGLGFDREARLAPGERVDFLVAGGTGVEAKTRCGKRTIYRQLERYAECTLIKALVLVTGSALGLPAELNGKPLFHVSIGRSAL